MSLNIPMGVYLVSVVFNMYRQEWGCRMRYKRESDETLIKLRWSRATANNILWCTFTHTTKWLLQLSLNRLDYNLSLASYVLHLAFIYKKFIMHCYFIWMTWALRAMYMIHRVCVFSLKSTSLLFIWASDLLCAGSQNANVLNISGSFRGVLLLRICIEAGTLV